MALHIQSSFSAGEIDPALHERTNLQKFQAALATARNVYVGKSGRLISRPGRKFVRTAKLANREVILHSMPQIGVLLEWGHLYVRVLDAEDGSLTAEFSHSWTEAQLPSLEFHNIGEALCMIVEDGSTSQLLFPLGEDMGFSNFGFLGTGFFGTPPPPTWTSITANAGAPAGYGVQYAATVVVNGQESLPVTFGTSKLLPINADEANDMVLLYNGTDLQDFLEQQEYQLNGTNDVLEAVWEFRIFRRPLNGGAFGFIGSTTKTTFVNNAGFPNDDVTATFTDIGQSADYSQSPPSTTTMVRARGGDHTSLNFLGPATAAIYQQRLLLGIQDQIEASRSGYLFNFTRDYPLAADSALSFKFGIQGTNRILRMIDSDGLVVFTSRGVWLHTGVMSPSNLALEKKGNWIIDYRVIPIAIPGGVLFVDSATNTVRQLLWSEEKGAYVGEELSIFNNHLFTGNRIKSWTFEEGDTPLLWVAFVDGTFASFTFEPDHQMKAWTRHDSITDVECVHFMRSGPAAAGFEALDVGKTFFVVAKEDGTRYIESVVPRYVTSDVQIADPEADKNESIAAMDGMATWKQLLNDRLAGADEMVLTPVISDTWDGNLTLTCGTSKIFKEIMLDQVGVPGPGVIGQVFRWFHPVELYSIDLEVITVTTENSVVVTPSELFPEEYGADNPRIYLTTDVLNTEYLYEFGTKISGTTTVVTTEAFPVDTINWDTPLTLNSSAGIFTTGGTGAGVVGAILGHDSTVLGRTVLFEVLSRTDNFTVVVQPVGLMTDDLTESNDLQLYVMTAVPTFSMAHLNNENVSVISDGSVLASPNNNIENYTSVVVDEDDNSISIPNSERGAIIHIGRPYVMDIETLDIDTVEQRPILIESETVNKLYVKVYNSRGLYAGAKFPADDAVEGLSASGIEEVRMQDTDTIPVDHEEEDEIVGNRYDRPRSVRREITLKGEWKSQGRVCLRQVDPLHFEILSIIPDIEGLERGR